MSASPSFVYNQLGLKAARREARERGVRRRVCVSCRKATDYVMGTVHSELPCSRCKSPGPCWGFIVEERDR